jgi:adenylyltransferase/sulfurtransferase
MDGDKLSVREIRRYSKQIILPEIGLPGQEKLKNAKVLVIGAGGLGCPALQYLTAAGVGKIGIAEFDLVDETNLQRQVLYGSTDVGKYLNSNVDLELFNLRCDASNSLRIFKNWDVIVDTTDNLSSRYIINDACVILGKPMVHGAVYKYEGVVSVFNYKGGPTYRCYNPQTNNDDFKNPLPSEVGLFGVLPGIIGAYLANEVIKVITESGDILCGKVLMINILKNTFKTFNVTNVPENHNIKSLE